MIKLESGNPPLQLGKAVCNSADYPLIKQYAARFLMLQQGEQQRETRHSVVPPLPPASLGDCSYQDGQNSCPGSLCSASQATLTPCPGTVRAGESNLHLVVSLLDFSLAKLGDLQKSWCLSGTW